MMYTNKQLLQLTLPLFAEQFLIVFVGVADTFMVSYAGEAAVSGVALVDTISFLITAVLGALCTGGAVVEENMETSMPGVFACGNAAGWCPAHRTCYLSRC